MNNIPETTQTPIQRMMREALSFTVTVGILLAIAFLFIRPTLLEPYQIPSASMVPTLEIGDRILVNKLSYGLRAPFVTYMLTQWSTPSRGEVVVFTRPDEVGSIEDESSINIIKRVVGIGGDTVELKGPHLYVNGQLTPEFYARYSSGGLKDFGPETVPAGHVFLLGDNRDNSKDARWWQEPFVDSKRIKGRAFLIYWSWSGFERIGTVIR